MRPRFDYPVSQGRPEVFLVAHERDGRAYLDFNVEGDPESRSAFLDPQLSPGILLPLDVFNDLDSRNLIRGSPPQVNGGPRYGSVRIVIPQNGDGTPERRFDLYVMGVEEHRGEKGVYALGTSFLAGIGSGAHLDRSEPGKVKIMKMVEE